MLRCTRARGCVNLTTGCKIQTCLLGFVYGHVRFVVSVITAFVAAVTAATSAILVALIAAVVFYTYAVLGCGGILTLAGCY